MDVQAALKVLAATGSEETRKAYGRHGVRGAMFGVPQQVLADLAQQIGRSQEVARSLWNSRIHEARLLATKIADPETMTSDEFDAWARELGNYVESDALAGLVAASPHGREIVDRWIESTDEWTSAAGWTAMYTQVVGDGGVSVEQTRPESELPRLLARIERQIHAAPNRTRYAMNSALIGIGMRSDALERRAVAAAMRIGPVAVDHGQTECKTPDAASYIPKARKYAAARQARMPRRKLAVAVASAAPVAVKTPARPSRKHSAKRVRKPAPRR